MDNIDPNAGPSHSEEMSNNGKAPFRTSERSTRGQPPLRYFQEPESGIASNKSSAIAKKSRKKNAALTNIVSAIDHRDNSEFNDDQAQGNEAGRNMQEHNTSALHSSKSVRINPQSECQRVNAMF